MTSVFENVAAFGPMGETVRWRQDKAPHKTAAFPAVVLHGESQGETAGPTRGGFAADPWSVIVDGCLSACAGIQTGDTVTLSCGLVLTVQQVSRDPAMGWVMRCTANARAPL